MKRNYWIRDPNETDEDILKDIDRMTNELKYRLTNINEQLIRDNAQLDSTLVRGEKNLDKIGKMNVNLNDALAEHKITWCPWWIWVTVLLWIFTYIIIRVFPKS